MVNENEKIEKDVMSLKRSMNDWVLFLDGNQRDSRQHIRILERRIRELESKQRVY